MKFKEEQFSKKPTALGFSSPLLRTSRYWGSLTTNQRRSNGRKLPWDSFRIPIDR